MRFCLLNSLMWKRGGAELFCLEMMKALTKNRKDELFVICEKLPKDFKFKINDYDVNVLETGFSGIASGNKINAAKGWILLPKFARKVADIITKVKPDIINPHDFPDVFYACYYKSHKNNDVKISWFCHEPYRQFYDIDVLQSGPISERLFFTFYRTVFVPIDIKYVRSQVDAIGSNSKYTAELVKRIYARESKIIYPGIDTERFRPVVTTLKDDLDCDSLILSVGRIEFSYKNLQIVPIVLSKIRKKYNVKWIHIGSGPDKLKFLSLARSYDVLDSLEIVDYVTDKKLIEYYSSADVVVYTPIREPFGFVPLEAMACGTPVIASEHGGPAETILNEKTGLLVDLTSISEVTRAISFLFENKCIAIKMGVSGRERVCNNFTLQKTIDGFYSFIYS